MTVAELLDRLSKAFPAFNSRAIEAWAPVFKARFGNREGPHLAAALTECMSTFEPKARGKLFPTPPDIEAAMPTLRTAADSNERPIRALLNARTARATVNFADWFAGQGKKIKANRPQPVADACILEALHLAPNRTPLLLTAEEIATCEQRAISQARVAKFGRIPRKAEEREAQIAQIRIEWATPNAQAAA